MHAAIGAAQAEHPGCRFVLHRCPFFLEPRYLSQPESFTETHLSRMVRKFGDQKTFERFKRSHGLVPRAREVGLPWTEELLSQRTQSATLRSHRLVLWIAAMVKKRARRKQQQQQQQLSNSNGNNGESATEAAEAAEVEAAEAQEALYASLNRRHFEEGGVLNDLQLLLAAVAEVGPRFGVTAAEAEAFLTGVATTATTKAVEEGDGGGDDDDDDDDDDDND